ncbi:delta-like protein 4 [Hermetia illucens]|nr:delta-like protein 4 [Hermetia illucens]XP_037918237.1 delta-like protein 4 [Hermetia illucens]
MEEHKYLILVAVLLIAYISNFADGGLRSKQVPKWKKQACEFPSYQNEQSHYVCDSTGDVKCLPGWQGDLCDVPICRKGCDPMQGYCTKPGECRCKLGYYGERCDKCIPLPGCQHGSCNESFECKCHKGWDGLFCSEPMCTPNCHATRGYCEQPGECRCKLGWSGPTCQDCQVLPGCQHGTCTKPLECKCLPGYTGILCQIPICSETCHRQRGYCRRPGECRCKVGWTGEDCSKCHPYPGCVHGDCRKPWECNCKPGWGGMLCDQELKYCEENPDTCLNGGRCISLLKEDGNFRCLCPNEFWGRRCETALFTTISPPTIMASPSGELLSSSSTSSSTLAPFTNTSGNNTLSSLPSSSLSSSTMYANDTAGSDDVSDSMLVVGENSEEAVNDMESTVEMINAPVLPNEDDLNNEA